MLVCGSAIGTDHSLTASHPDWVLPSTICRSNFPPPTDDGYSLATKQVASLNLHTISSVLSFLSSSLHQQSLHFPFTVSKHYLLAHGQDTSEVMHFDFAPRQHNRNPAKVNSVFSLSDPIFSSPCSTRVTA